MVSLGKWHNQPVTLSIKPNCVTFSIEKGLASHVYSFDLEGRWWTGMVNGISYRRGLNGRVVAKWSPEANQHERRWLSVEESFEVERNIRAEFSRFILALSNGLVDCSPSPSGLEIELLRKLADYSAENADLDVKQYSKIYKPVGILPPDQYMAVVLQATEGCSFNTCSFCTFYRDRPFRIKQPAEFESHVQAIKHYLGKGLSLRRTIFLGDANALVMPMRRLFPHLETIHKHFDVQKLGGIYAFLDGFSGERKTVADYRQLGNLGLRRIYIGMESGDAELLKFLKKPGSPVDVLQAVRAIKEGGISVGIILLLGAGGKDYSATHIQESVRLLNQMNLDLDDLIYFSELIESEGMDYTKDAYLQKLTPLSGEERLRQAEEIEEGLRFPADAGTPHISRYDIREFVY